MTTVNLGKIYTRDGDILEFASPVPVFRKENYHSAHEKYIVNIIMNNPMKHVVAIKKIEPTYYDSELLETPLIINKQNIEVFMESMEKAKCELQQQGIMYIDWKLDNIGMINGIYKVFDFDMSGVATKNGKWFLVPPRGFMYKSVFHEDTPENIDNACFQLFRENLYKDMEDKTNYI